MKRLACVCTPYKVILASALVVLMSAANASVVRDDFRALGDGRVTFDTETNIDWLYLAMTGGLTVAQVTAALPTEYAGFRYASAAEVDELWHHAGIVGNGGLGFNGPLTSFSDLWGQLLGFGYVSGFSSYFFTSESDPTDSLLRSYGSFFISVNSWSFDSTAGYFYSPKQIDYVIQNFGHALVREHIEIPVPPPIPEPETYALMLLGLSLCAYRVGRTSRT
jgi:hypothetical protein